MRADGRGQSVNTGDTGQVISNLTLRDCEVYGAGASWQMSESNNTPFVGLTNNVFHRVPFAVSNNATLMSFNNLFYGTTNTNGFTVSIRHRVGTLSPNMTENNVFDGVAASLDGLVGYNAYLHGATNFDYTNNHDIWTNLTWLAGPLGAYYQAANSPLLADGSTYATNLGLYHYTVTTNNVIEGTNIVSRGYHYIAVDTNSVPLDSNGDGLPDYVKDSNGDGVYDSGDLANWLARSTSTTRERHCWAGRRPTCGWAIGSLTTRVTGRTKPALLPTTNSGVSQVADWSGYAVSLFGSGTSSQLAYPVTSNGQIYLDCANGDGPFLVSTQLEFDQLQRALRGRIRSVFSFRRGFFRQWLVIMGKKRDQ